MKFNELKVRDKVKVSWPTNGKIFYGSIFSMSDDYTHLKDHCLVLFPNEAWSRPLPISSILAKIEDTVISKEIPITSPIYSFEFSPRSYVIDRPMTSQIREGLTVQIPMKAFANIKGFSDTDMGNQEIFIPMIPDERMLPFDSNTRLRVTVEKVK